MATNDGRFAGVAGGDDYHDLFKLAAPHGDAMQARAAQILVEHCPSTATDPVTVLELGFGTGITTQHLLRADPHVRIFGCDNEPKMLEEARRNIGDGDRVQLMLADAYHFLGLISEWEPISAVVSGFCLHNLNPGCREEILTLVGERLRPGGIFVNLDKIAHDDWVEHHNALAEQIRAFDVFLEPSVNRSDVYREWVMHYLEDERVKITEGEMETILKHSGFSSVRFESRVLMDVICVAVK